jgi:hypothetical protein
MNPIKAYQISRLSDFPEDMTVMVAQAATVLDGAASNEGAAAGLNLGSAAGISV